MARKTKAELAAEREAAVAARMLADAEAYPAKLMAALEEATQKNNYELTVANGMFSLRDRNASRAPALSLTAAYTENSWNALESLEWDLEQYAEERAEAERLTQVRRAAFAKLSEEEKSALGLTDRNNW
jgi:hypothetical protein